jgi:hypothetical protein
MKPNASPTGADMLDEAESLLCTMALYGPPVIFLVAPWLLLGLVLIGPFAVLVALVVALFAAVALVVAIGALLATPFLMIRKRRAAHATSVELAPRQRLEYLLAEGSDVRLAA